MNVKTSIRRAVLALGLCAYCVPQAASAAPQPFTYSVGSILVSDLGTLGGTNSEAFDINDQGDIVGRSEDAAHKYHAFIFLNGQQMLSIHSGTPAWSYAGARGINNDQVVVGGYVEAATGLVKPFYYYPGIWLTPSPTNASAPLSLTWEAAAFSINSSHRIVGWARRHPMSGDPPVPDTQGACHDKLPVRWPNAGANPVALFCIADPDGDNQVDDLPIARDISDSGDIVGNDEGTSTYSMFLFRNGVRHSIPWVAGGWPTIDHGGEALGVNSNGWVVGSVPYYDSDHSFRYRAFAWNGTDALSTDVGLFPGGLYSRLERINESNIGVGIANRDAGGGGGTGVGFIWHKHFGMKQLPSRWLTGSLSSPRPTHCEAHAINELKSGIVQAVGFCYTPAGNRHAVRWDITINVVYQPTS